jgi:hypothetical protein
MSQFSFSSSVRSSMIIELVLVIPRSTGLDSKYGRPQKPPKMYHKSGAVAQLGERLICIQEVAGSIPTSSTKWACSSGG